MPSRPFNIFLIAATLLTVIGYEFGLLSNGDAFFGAMSLAILFTGRQLAARDGMMIGEAFASLFNKAHYPRPAAFAAYVGVVGFCLMVLIQTLAVETLI